MSTRPFHLSVSTLALLTVAAAAQAQTASSDGAADASGAAFTLDEIVVVADKVGLIETNPRDTVFGLNMSLLETPRSATFVSDLTIERYGIEEVDDLIAITPGAFTASFYGVKGAVNLRGTLAETYFRGFKRVENRGTYPTPLGATSQIEILRGPPSPIHGPGKVGGYLNIVPKTTRVDGTGYIDSLMGDAEVTIGSYDKFNISGDIGVPLKLGSVTGGALIYAELEDSNSFYRGVEPEHKLVQVNTDFNLTDNLVLSVGGMYYDAEGYIQTPGWNRLTQDLIDNQTYITGRDTSATDADGNGRMTPNEIGGLVTGYFGFPPTPPDYYTLDEGVGTTELSPRTVFISDADFSDTRTNTVYVDLVRTFDNESSVKLQFFYDDLENKRFVSYGFPAWYDSSVFEFRGSYDFTTYANNGNVVMDTVLGASYRSADATKRESFNSGYIALDRRDISFGATANDIMDDAFSTEPGNIGLQWDNDVDSEWSDLGVFALSHIAVSDMVHLLVGGRYDYYDMEATDVGAVTFGPPAGEADGGDFTWNASLSFTLPMGISPYITYADSSALELGQAGDITPGLMLSDQWLSDSELQEAGVKFDLFNTRLVGSLAGYKQTRTRLSVMDNVVATEAKGVEMELRWLATDNLSFTFSGNVQKTTVKGPDAGFTYIPATATGLDLMDAYGGSFAVFNFSQFGGGHPGDYKLRSIPDEVFSLYGSYIDDFSWGEGGITLGGTYVGETSGKLADPVVYPDYMLANAAVFVAMHGFELSFNVDNVFDKLYFQPVADVYADMAVLPGRGREWRLKLKKAF